MKPTWQTIVAKPMITAAWVALSLLAVACSPVSSEQAARRAPEVAEVQPTEVPESANEAPGEVETEQTAEVVQGSTAGSDDEEDSTPTGERGSRNLGDADGEQVEAPTATSDSAEASEPEDDAPAAAATPVPTTPPIATSAPVPVAANATVVPIATPIATAVPTPTAEPVFVSPQPSGPVPSDDIVITGPQIDESESSSISDNGATACALVESAIEFLDFGDSSRVASTLQEAAGFALQSSEAEIAGTAAALSAAGTNDDAAFAAIVAALQACAVHGYQV